MRFVLFLITATLTVAGDFATSIGDTYPYLVSAMTTDSTGNTYVVGSRALGSANAVDTSCLINSTLAVALFTCGAADVFVTKLDPNGNLLFTNTYAGKGVDIGLAITVDSAGNIYIAGTTTSADFPLSHPLSNQPSSYGAGFIMKLATDGAILYSTYFGGTLGATSISALATDAKGNLYLTGTSTASDFPHTAGMPFSPLQPTASRVISGAIIASISAAGDKILYSGALVGGTVGCFGGPPNGCVQAPIATSGVGIGVDAAGSAYIAGNTNTADLPATTGALSAQGPGPFVAKINPAGTGLSYLTYVGGGEDIQSGEGVVVATTLAAIAVDAAGDAYLTGTTSDQNLPTTPGTVEPVFTGGPFGAPQPFVAKLKPDGTGVIWATYLGSYTTVPQAVAVDTKGNVWIAGLDYFGSIPNTNGWFTPPPYSAVDFIVELNFAGSALAYSALDPQGTIGQAVALDSSGVVHVAGMNGFVSAIAPTSAPSIEIFDFENAFETGAVLGAHATARISPAEVIAIYGPGIGPATPTTAAPTNGFYPTTLAGVQVTINGINMPLLYVSANQINAAVPMELAVGSGATVRVMNGTTQSPDYPVWIVGSTPLAFPTVLNQDGTINSSSNPAKAGSIVTFYATGWQSNFSPLSDGQVATTAQDQCAGTCNAGANETVLYGGAAPGIVAGVSQFNVQLGPYPNLTGVAGILIGPGTFAPPLTQTIPATGAWVTP